MDVTDRLEEMNDLLRPRIPPSWAFLVIAERREPTRPVKGSRSAHEVAYGCCILLHLCRLPSVGVAGVGPARVVTRASGSASPDTGQRSATIPGPAAPRE